MSTTLNAYPDLLSGTSETPGTSLEERLRRKVRKVKKQCNNLRKHFAELREKHTAEIARIAEERRVAEEKKQEKDSFFSRVKSAIIKAIPALIPAIFGFFAKKWFSS